MIAAAGLLPVGVDWPTRTLALTSSRLLVYDLPKHWWGFPLAEVSGLRSEGRCQVAVIDDEEVFVEPPGPNKTGEATYSSHDETRLQFAIDFSDGDSVLLVYDLHPSPLFGASPETTLDGWINECNHYLDLVHMDASRAENYVETIRAYVRGAGRAVDALVEALRDSDDEVRSLAAPALKRIGGPQATTAPVT
jgi:hypothetical protein